MIDELVEDAGERAPGELLSAYRAALAAVVEDVGREAVADASGLAPERLDELAAGEPAELTLGEAAAVLAASGKYPDADAIVAEARDDLLMGMTTAVLDVDALAANLDADLSPTEVQQRLEGRAEMTLEEFAMLQSFIEGRQR